MVFEMWKYVELFAKIFHLLMLSAAASYKVISLVHDRVRFSLQAL